RRKIVHTTHFSFPPLLVKQCSFLLLYAFVNLLSIPFLKSLLYKFTAAHLCRRTAAENLIIQYYRRAGIHIFKNYLHGCRRRIDTSVRAIGEIDRTAEFSSPAGVMDSIIAIKGHPV